MKPRISDAHEVLREVATLLARKYENPKEILQQVTEQLLLQRRYYWVGIYANAGARTALAAASGPEALPCCDAFELGQAAIGTAAESGKLKVIPEVTKDSSYAMCFAETQSAMVVPLKIAGRVVGVLDVESKRVNGISPQDQVLLKEAAKHIARYLATEGKALTRKLKLREAERQSAQIPAKLQPESDRGAKHLQAAAGDAPRA